MKRIKKKQAGITLVELLVAMLCGTIAISMIVGTTLFITFSTDELVEVGSQSYRVQTIKDYILSQHHESNPSAEYELNKQEQTLSHNGTAIARDTQLLNIEFSENENFIYCTFVFPKETYRFVAGTKKGG